MRIWRRRRSTSKKDPFDKCKNEECGHDRICHLGHACWFIDEREEECPCVSFRE